MLEPTLVTAATLLLATCTMGTAQDTATAPQTGGPAGYEPVLELRPVGYWPADEGEGEILHDRSGNDNHGKVFHTPWEDGLLDFTSGFQWAEVPGHERYQAEAFTIGGWLFTRRASYQRNGMLFVGIANPIRLWIEPSIILRVREAREVDVATT